MNAARHRAWAQIEARHGSIPGIRIADKTLDGVIGIRLDATVTPAYSDKEGAEPNFKGFGHHPLLSYCDNTDEPLAGMLRPGSAGSNTAADHITVLDEAITALPPGPRTLPPGSAPDSISALPRRTVFTSAPVARAITATPPPPIA